VVVVVVVVVVAGPPHSVQNGHRLHEFRSDRSNNQGMEVECTPGRLTPPCKMGTAYTRPSVQTGHCLHASRMQAKRPKQ